MKYKITLKDGIELLITADKEVDAVRQAKDIKDSLTNCVNDAQFPRQSWATNSGMSPDWLNSLLKRAKEAIEHNWSNIAEKAEKDALDYIREARAYQAQLKKDIEQCERGFKEIESEFSRLKY